MLFLLNGKLRALSTPKIGSGISPLIHKMKAKEANIMTQASARINSPNNSLFENKQPVFYKLILQSKYNRTCRTMRKTLQMPLLFDQVGREPLNKYRSTLPQNFAPMRRHNLLACQILPSMLPFNPFLSVHHRPLGLKVVAVFVSVGCHLRVRLGSLLSTFNQCLDATQEPLRSHTKRRPIESIKTTGETMHSSKATP